MNGMNLKGAFKRRNVSYSFSLFSLIDENRFKNGREREREKIHIR